MSKEEVLLVNLPFPFNRYFVIDREVSGSADYSEHLGLETLAAVLRANSISVKIIDAFAKKLRVQDIADEVSRGGYKLVGFSLFDFSASILGELCDKIKSTNKGIHITCGGHCVTNTYKDLLERFKNLDSVIRGEGELTLLELCQKVIKGESWSDIYGLAYKMGNEVCLSPSRPLIDNLDAMPFPSKDFIDEKVREGRKIDTIHLYTSRGCYGTCNFCDIKAFYGDKKGGAWRARSAKNVVDEMEYLQKKYNPLAFSICDDNFIGIGKKGKIRAEEIAKEIIRRDLKVNFYISCRVDDVEPQLFELLKKAGLNSVFLGVENFSQSELDFFNKLVKYECNCKAIDLLKSKGILPTLGHISFTPHTRLVDISRNIKFLEKYDCIDYFKATFLQRYPGTAFFNDNSGDIFKQEYSVFDHSSFRKPEFYFTDRKSEILAKFIQEDHWFIYNFAAFSRCFRNYYLKPWSKRYELLHYQKFLNDVKETSLRRSLDYLKHLISVLENEEDIDCKANIIRNEWKSNNAKIRKLLIQVKNEFNAKKEPLWKYFLNPFVKTNMENGNYSYRNLSNNSFVVLNKDSHEMLHQVLNMDFITNDRIETNFKIKPEDFYRFLQYLIERDIVKYEDLNIPIWNEASALLHIQKDETICWNINNTSDGSIAAKDAVKYLTSQNCDKMMLICDNFSSKVEQDIDEIGNRLRYIGVQTDLDNSCMLKDYVEKVDQFVFTLGIDELKDRLHEIQRIYEELKYKMPYDPVFAVKGFKKEDLSDLITIKLPVKINILADRTAYSSAGEDKQLIAYVNRFIDKLPYIGLVYSNLEKVGTVSEEMNQKPRFIINSHRGLSLE